MKKYTSAVNFFNLRNLTAVALLLALTWPDAAQAQGDGPRFYWKGLNQMNAVPLIVSSLGGNANPFDPSLTVLNETAEFKATMSSVGYARVMSVFKRSAMLSVVAPMGRLSGTVNLNGTTHTATARGYGDPMVQLSLNVIGPKAIMNIPDMLRYKPGFSVDVIGSLCIPVGEYDNTSPINLGQNRWYGRVGFPVVWQLGSWVPGRRTTLELLPAVWLMGDNTDFNGGQTLSTKPMYQVEAHLTRDFMERLWGSLDVISMSGGEASIDGMEGEALSNLGVGGTIGYQINENMMLNLSYSSTVNDNDPQDLNMDGFRITILYGWHKLVEGMHRLKNE